MKMVLTFTCFYCDGQYDHEMDVDPSTVTAKPGEQRIFVGVCWSCMKKKDKMDEVKAFESFLKRRDAEINEKVR